MRRSSARELSRFQSKTGNSNSCRCKRKLSLFSASAKSSTFPKRLKLPKKTITASEYLRRRFCLITIEGERA